MFAPGSGEVEPLTQRSEEPVSSWTLYAAQHGQEETRKSERVRTSATEGDLKRKD